jgi:hypothetical protein
MSDFFPGKGPTPSEFWKRRPFGPKFTLNPFEMDAYDVGWMIAHAGSLAYWTHKTGMGVSLNTLLGGIFFETPGISTTSFSGRAHWHTTGASPTFTGGVARSQFARNLARSATPWVVASVGREVLERDGFYDDRAIQNELAVRDTQNLITAFWHAWT